MSVLVSIIVPCYNAASTINRTIKSVLKQSCDQWELIMIDDGSDDNTAACIRKFTDPRIRLFQQKNKGASAARNHGMQIAHGEWLCFLDADDALLPDAISTLLSEIESDTNIIIGCYQNSISPLPRITPAKAVKISGRRLAANTLFWQKYEDDICRDVFAPAPALRILNTGAPWAKLYRKSFIEQHHLRFNEALVLHEDTLFNHLAYSHTKEASIIPIPVYCYLDNPASLTRSQNSRYRKHCAAAIGEFSRLHPDFPEELCFFSMFRILECWHGIHTATKGDLLSRHRLIREFMNTPEIRQAIPHLPVRRNRYIPLYDKAAIFCIKHKLYLSLIILIPQIQVLHSFKNRFCTIFRV
mgnify:CR=1 FL=1